MSHWNSSLNMGMSCTFILRECTVLKCVVKCLILLWWDIIFMTFILEMSPGKVGVSIGVPNKNLWNCCVYWSCQYTAFFGAVLSEWLGCWLQPEWPEPWCASRPIQVINDVKICITVATYCEESFQSLAMQLSSALKQQSKVILSWTEHSSWDSVVRENDLNLSWCSVPTHWLIGDVRKDISLELFRCFIMKSSTCKVQALEQSVHRLKMCMKYCIVSSCQVDVQVLEGYLVVWQYL